tara:strand:+ start:1150 stop:1680 length:531 start_codon:yes stop_codon:yes gene_type:complete
MDSTKSYVKIYNISPGLAEDFEFDYDTAGVEEGRSDILTELVPDLDRWGDLGWMEAEEYEYNADNQTLYLTLETKWEAPLEWLQEASLDLYFQNKLITMTTIQKDETCVRGIAVMDGEVLQNKYIFQMDSEEVGKYYNDDEVDYDLDDLDNQIWDSIAQFVNVCEQFYLEKEEENE